MAHLERADLVLQGGGVKGIALAGAVTVMMKTYRFARVAGTSAGAILAGLLAAGYDGDEIHALMLDLNYRRVPDRRWPIPYLGCAVDLMMSNGLHPGDYILEWIGNRLADRKVEKFADLRLPDDPEADPELTDDKGFRLVVTATDITRGRALRLPWDYRSAFGLDPAEQSVADAIRMSMSIPVFFEPCKLVDQRTGKASTIVDGGVLSNFPLEVFDRQDGRCPRWPTLGIGVIPDLPGPDGTLIPGLPIPPGPLRLLSAVAVTAMLGHDQTYLAQPQNAVRLTRIDTNAVGIVSFGIDEAARESLFRNGVSAAEAFLSGWNWSDYLARYYPGCVPSV
jgi:NTE family protein